MRLARHSSHSSAPARLGWPQLGHSVSLGTARLDLPALAPAVELVQVRRVPRLSGADLLHQELVVHRFLDGAEDTHRRREVGRSHAAQEVGQRRLGRALVVDEERVLAHVRDVHHLGREPVQADALLHVLAEQERFPVLQEEHVVGLAVGLGEVVPGAVVEDHAVLLDLDQARAAVARGAVEHRGHVLLERGHRPGDEARLGADRHAGRVDRVLDRAVGARLGALADLGRRRVLPLGQAVDAVVDEQDVDVDVAAQRVQEVVAADRQGVAISR